jgi:hypothetical protein
MGDDIGWYNISAYNLGSWDIELVDDLGVTDNTIVVGKAPSAYRVSSAGPA